jgi:hypothetical protein
LLIVVREAGSVALPPIAIGAPVSLQDHTYEFTNDSERSASSFEEVELSEVDAQDHADDRSVSDVESKDEDLEMSDTSSDDEVGTEDGDFETDNDDDAHVEEHSSSTKSTEELDLELAKELSREFCRRSVSSYLPCWLACSDHWWIGTIALI